MVLPLWFQAVLEAQGLWFRLAALEGLARKKGGPSVAGPRDATVQIATIYDPTTGELTLARWREGRVWPIRNAVKEEHWLYRADLGTVLARPEGLRAAMEALEGVGEPALDPEAVRFAPLIPRAGKVVCIGQNYWDHCREQNVKPPDRPILFAKLPNAYNAHRGPVPVPPGCQQLDYEAELAVVIGKTADRVSEAEALGCVAGYSLANDFTARDFQFGDRQWLRGKSQNGFGPVGPVLVTRDEVPDPQNLAIRCWVNGQLVQDSNTREMIFSVAQIIAFVSQGIRLEPGDILLTGTPHGVGIFRHPPLLLHPGDTVRVGIADWPELVNVVAP
ncbi:MAG: fumarylacetoacetate hydrolase family protein [Firmicutes bacterium]|nr:fumarylacetoacetate hydrolase family protein [Alicyclobacillaceae bacterium]MCL6498276.1 fumarylacetoacetate hydrolase family protein [Bacillota bacterium]